MADKVSDRRKDTGKQATERVKTFRKEFDVFGKTVVWVAMIALVAIWMPDMYRHAGFGEPSGSSEQPASPPSNAAEPAASPARLCPDKPNRVSVVYCTADTEWTAWFDPANGSAGTFLCLGKLDLLDAGYRITDGHTYYRVRAKEGVVRFPMLMETDSGCPTSLDSY